MSAPSAATSRVCRAARRGRRGRGAGCARGARGSAYSGSPNFGSMERKPCWSQNGNQEWRLPPKPTTNGQCSVPRERVVQTYDLERHFTASVGGRGRTVRVVVEGGPVRHDFPQACEALGRGQALFFLVVANSLLLTALTRRDRVNPLASRVRTAETKTRFVWLDGCAAHSSSGTVPRYANSKTLYENAQVCDMTECHKPAHFCTRFYSRENSEIIPT